MRRNVLAASVLAALMGVLMIARNVQAAADSCDRACLQSMVDQYLAALVANNPAQAPLAKKVKFTENGQALAPGDGLWGTANALGTYKLYMADPEQGAAGFIGVVKESDKPVILSLRLKVKKGRITEVETLIARDTFGALGGEGNAGAGAAHEQQGKPKDVFLENLAPGERSTRHDMVAIANSYFSGLERGNTAITVPFDPQCNRQENGVQTTNNPKLDSPTSQVKIFAMSCAEQFKSGFLQFVTEIRNRRFVVVDEERGLVFAYAFFDHSGVKKIITLADGRTMPSPVRAPLTFEIAEMFKIKSGKIRQIEASLITVPYHMKSAWDE